MPRLNGEIIAFFFSLSVKIQENAKNLLNETSVFQPIPQSAGEQIVSDTPTNYNL